MILDEECAAIAETVRARAWERLAPHAAEIDRTQAFSKPVWEELRSMGIFGLPFAPEAGGAGASTLAYIVSLEQVAYSCAVAALYPGTTVQVAQALLAHAPEPVVARWVPRLVAGEVPAAWAFTEPQTGSDPRQLTTRVRRDGDGWVLDGQKMFISYAAEAAVALVFAVTEEQQVCAINVGVAQRALHEATACALQRTHRGTAIGAKLPARYALTLEVGGMTQQPVTYAVSDGVAVITLSRPQARNAIDSTLAAALIDAFTRAESDPEVRAIVVTGADPAFCGGLDLKEFTRLQRPPARASEVIVMAGRLTKPALGAINGPVMTGGLELALGLDVLIASERARFADTHAAVGILPGGGMTARLPRAVGARMAMEMSYTGRVIDAAEAERIGLVNHVVAHEDLLPATLAMAATIASRDPAVLRQLKELYRVSTTVTMGAAMAHELRERDRRRASGQVLTPRRL